MVWRLVLSQENILLIFFFTIIHIQKIHIVCSVYIYLLHGAITMMRKMLSICFLVLMLANPVLGAVKLDNITTQDGVDAVQDNEAINEPLMKLLLLSIGIVFFLGFGALLKCGGASFGGIIVGTPRSAASGLLGMCSVILMGVCLVTGMSIYMSWV